MEFVELPLMATAVGASSSCQLAPDTKTTRFTGCMRCATGFCSNVAAALQQANNVVNGRGRGIRKVSPRNAETYTDGAQTHNLTALEASSSRLMKRTLLLD